ncbi:hypothetical protein B0O99DRAFT_621685 [Bisporella sp. PMI_857]|nr:hypothetical protein B0O99DRAFT_621685 [Bisporella sp. PMI_857]
MTWMVMLHCVLGFLSSCLGYGDRKYLLCIEISEHSYRPQQIENQATTSLVREISKHSSRFELTVAGLCNAPKFVYRVITFSPATELFCLMTFRIKNLLG